jgi:hypothetical protein
MIFRKAAAARVDHENSRNSSVVRAEMGDSVVGYRDLALPMAHVSRIKSI